MPRKLKKWNGMLIFHKHIDGTPFEGRSPQLSVYLAAYSQKDALELLEGYGCHTSLYEFRGWWNPACWGNAMDGIEADKRGMWIDYHDDNPPQFVEPGTKVY